MEQTHWHRLAGCDSPARLAISSHADGKLYVVAVRNDGQVAYSSFRKHGDGWAPWSVVNDGSSSTLPAATSTPSVLRRGKDDHLYLFCRGVDDNLYVTSRYMDQDWSAWKKLTADNSVHGRASVVFTGDPWFCHVVHLGPSDTVRYRRFDASWSLVGSSQWTNAREAELGSDSSGEILVALLRTTDRLSLARQSLPWSSTWQPVLTEHGLGISEPCFGLSNIVHNELVQRYVADGDALREIVVSDLRSGVDLLRRKYDWVRRFIFRGVKFGRNGIRSILFMS